MEEKSKCCVKCYRWNTNGDYFCNKPSCPCHTPSVESKECIHSWKPMVSDINTQREHIRYWNQCVKCGIEEEKKVVESEEKAKGTSYCKKCGEDFFISHCCKDYQINALPPQTEEVESIKERVRWAKGVARDEAEFLRLIDCAIDETVSSTEKRVVKEIVEMMQNDTRFRCGACDSKVSSLVHSMWCEYRKHIISKIQSKYEN